MRSAAKKTLSRCTMGANGPRSMAALKRSSGRLIACYEKSLGLNPCRYRYVRNNPIPQILYSPEMSRVDVQMCAC